MKRHSVSEGNAQEATEGALRRVEGRVSPCTHSPLLEASAVLRIKPETTDSSCMAQCDSALQFLSVSLGSPQRCGPGRIHLL
jgi:hypothetical protein